MDLFLIEVYLFVYFFMGILGMACYHTWNDTSVISYPYTSHVCTLDVVRVSQATITYTLYVGTPIVPIITHVHLHTATLNS